MRRLARRLDDEAGEIEPVGQLAGGDRRLQRGGDPGLEILENVHESLPGNDRPRLYRKFAVGSKSRRYSLTAKRSVMPAM